MYYFFQNLFFYTCSEIHRLQAIDHHRRTRSVKSNGCRRQMEYAQFKPKNFVKASKCMMAIGQNGSFSIAEYYFWGFSFFDWQLSSDRWVCSSMNESPRDSKKWEDVVGSVRNPEMPTDGGSDPRNQWKTFLFGIILCFFASIRSFFASRRRRLTNIIWRLVRHWRVLGSRFSYALWILFMVSRALHAVLWISHSRHAPKQDSAQTRTHFGEVFGHAQTCSDHTAKWIRFLRQWSTTPSTKLESFVWFDGSQARLQMTKRRNNK